MKKHILIPLFTTMMLVGCGGSQSESTWEYVVKSSNFDDDEHTLATSSDGYRLFLSCTNAERLKIIIMTPKKVTQAELANLAWSYPNLLIQIDDNDVYSRGGRWANSDHLGVISSVPIKFAREMTLGKRVALGLKVDGTGSMLAEHSFSTEGYEPQSSKIIEGCGL